MSEYQKLIDGARGAAESSQNADELALARSEFLGKKSLLSDAKKGLGKPEEVQRAAAGKELNEVRNLIEEVFEQREAALQEETWNLQFESERLDLSERLESLRRGHLHLITQARDHLEDVFVELTNS